MITCSQGAELSDEYIELLRGNFSKIELVDMFKWILVLSGLLTMIAAFVMVMYREKLLCFSKVGNATITHVKRNDDLPTIETLSEMQFNNTVMYPNLYPQIENKNIHDGLSKRQQWNHAQGLGDFNVRI